MSTELSHMEMAEFGKQDRIVEQTKDSVLECGRALMAIQKGRLWRGDFGSFEDYVSKRLGIPRSTAYYRISVARREDQRPAVAEPEAPEPDDDDVPPDDSGAEEFTEPLNEPQEVVQHSDLDTRPTVTDCLGMAVEGPELAQVFTEGVACFETLVADLRSIASRISILKKSAAGFYIENNVGMWLKSCVRFMNAAVPYCQTPDDVPSGRYRDAGFMTESGWKEWEQNRQKAR